MGAWGSCAWENDAAADWFSDLFERTGLAQELEKCLRSSFDNGFEEVRAAAYVVSLLARTYIYPVDDIDGHRSLARERLMEILRDFADDIDSDTERRIRSEIDNLGRPA